MQTKSLGEICNIITGSTPLTKYPEYYGGDFLRACPADLDQGNIVIQTKKTLSEKGIKEGKIRIVPKGSVMVCCIGTIGKCAIASQDMATNQQINSFVPKKDILDSLYLLYSIKFHENVFQTKATSTTVPILNKSQCADINIPLPSLTTQQAIAAKLDAIQTLIDDKKQSIAKTDELAKSIFIDMFGDPVTNEKGWEVKKLGEVNEITSSKRIFQNEYVSGGIPFYRTKEIVELSKGEKISLELYISEERYKEIKDNFSIPKVGDILISAVGTIGITRIVNHNEPFYFKDGNLLWIKKSDQIDPNYLSFYLSTFLHSQKETIVAGSGYNALTIQNLKKLEIPLPPLPLQQQFAAAISQLQQVQDDNKLALAKLEELFAATMQECFS